jgi:hypothetical protein
MTKMRVQAAGIPWYKREEYDEIRRVMEDAASLPKEFDTWLQKALQVKEHLKGQGVVAVEAYIDPSEFVAWCRGRGLHVDSAARIEYANLVAAEAHRHGTA